MNGRGHIDVHPNAGIVEAQMGGNEEAGTGGLRVLSILQSGREISVRHGDIYARMWVFLYV